MSNYFTIYSPSLYLPDSDCDILRVTYKSKKRYRDIVEAYAYHFKRETHYDFVQFSSNENPKGSDFIIYDAYLFLLDDLNIKNYYDPIKKRVVGACCFRKRFLENFDHYWSMDWIWIHPYCRHRGLLKGKWEYFNNKYNGFYVEPPHSIEMEAFLQSKSWEDDVSKYIKKYQRAPIKFDE